MSKAEEIVGVRYSEMNEKQKRIYHNTLRNESHRRNKDKVKEQNRKYREKQKQYTAKLEHENKLLAKALELAVADKCNYENLMVEGIVGKGAKVLVPKKEQWYLEQAQKELRDEQMRKMWK